MLKGWVSKYCDRVLWVFLQAFRSIIARFIVPQEFTKIQTLLSTLQEPANNAYTHLYGTYHSNTCKCKQLKGLLIKGCGNRFHHESSSLNARDRLAIETAAMPLNWQVVNHSYSHVAILHSSCTVHGS